MLVVVEVTETRRDILMSMGWRLEGRERRMLVLHAIPALLFPGGAGAGINQIEGLAHERWQKKTRNFEYVGCKITFKNAYVGLI